MTNPDPIQQRIEVDLDKAGADEAARGIKQIGDASEKSGDQAAKSVPKLRTREQQLADQRQRLEQLIRSEDRYEQALKEGKTVTDRAVEASKRRNVEINKLSRGLAAERRVQDRLNDSVRQATGAQSEMTGATKLAANGLASLASTFVGGLGLTSIVQEFNNQIEASNRLLRENAQLSRDNAEARLDLAALSGVETPDDIAFLDSVAAFSGRSQGEVARVKTQIKSALPGASEQEVRSLVREVGGAGQISSASLGSLSPALLSIFRLTGDARVSGNLLQAAIDQAGEADPSRLAQEIEKFVGIGEKIGGFDPATNVGFASAGTGLGLPNELATTGLKNVLFSLKGKGTPEGLKVLEREGIPRDDVIEGLLAIQQGVAEGRISGADLESIGGREAAPVFAALSDGDTLNSFLAKIDVVRDAGQSSGRLSEEKAEGITSSSEAQSLNLLAKQQESITGSIKSADIGALQADAAKQIIRRVAAQRLAEGRISPAKAEAIVEEFDRLIGVGFEPEAAALRASSASTGFLDSLTGSAGDTLFSQEVRRGLETGPVTSFDEAFDQAPTPGRITINNGTIINHAGDTTEDDLVEGRPEN